MITDYMKVKGVCKWYNGVQVSGWYMKIPKIDKYVDVIITGSTVIDGLPCENGDSVRTIRYQEVVPSTIRRYVGIKDIEGTQLVERDLLQSELTKELFRVEFKLDGEIILVLLSQDACISHDIQEFVDKYQLKFHSDAYSN